MVKLLEFEGKEIFKKYGIKVPSGFIVKSKEDVLKNSSLFAPPMVVKAQVLVGGRGKRGGIRKVESIDDAAKSIDIIKTIDFDGYKAESFLLEKAVSVKKELYISITLDRSHRDAILMSSADGGMEIESIPDEKIFKYNLNSFVGIPEYVKRDLFRKLGLDQKYQKEFNSILSGLWRIYKEEDAELVEINPLGITDEGIVAMDSKVIIEDDALFRHSTVEKIDSTLDPLEAKAKEKGIAFVKLDGDIGVIANGAGLTMATLDALNYMQGKAGVFLDLGGTDDPDKVSEAFLLMTDAKPKVVFINIFGGVTRCDTVALGLVEAFKKVKPSFPIVVRIRGFREEEGRKIMKDNGYDSYLTLMDAIKAVVDLEKKR